MNTIEKLGDEETFKNIVERTITEFEDNEIEKLEMYAFHSCSKLTSVSLPSATSIGSYAFNSCSALTSVQLPVATSIGDYAFKYCSALTSVQLPAATSIGNYIFQSCSALTSVSLPAATSIGDGAFSNCSELTNVSLPVATSIGSSAFQSCSKLTNVSFPVAASINYGTFQYCSALTSASFPVATSIGSYAFGDCSALTSASFPAATSINKYAFDGCSKLTALYIGIESDTVCTLSSTNAIPSNVETIYVPVDLLDSYKTATNWSSFADKIQYYEVPVSCQSLTITAEDVLWYKTSTKIHYEAVCTYSIEGMMQTGTKVFKGDAVSDTFGANPSGESSRQIEVSYTFLGQTATTTITQGKYVGDPLGGTIFYIDDTADGEYEFYDADGNVISDVKVGDKPAMYKVLTPGTKDKYYVCNTTLYPNSRWTYYNNGRYVYNSLGTGTAIGTGKTNTDTVMAADNGAYITSDSNGYSTIWYQLSQARSLSLGGNTDWFIPSKDEMDKVSTSGIIPFSGIWSSSEYNYNSAWTYNRNYWDYFGKSSDYPVFFVRAF